MIKGIICKSCGLAAPKRGTGKQKYCLSCSERIALKRNSSRDFSEYRATRKSRVVENGKEISRLTIQRRIIDLPEMPINNGVSIYFCVPFNVGASKNNVYSLAKGGGHVFKRGQTRKFQDDLILLIRKAIKDSEEDSEVKIYQNKVWLSIFVQKPHHKGDAINVIDVICDAIKKAIDLDDRWFCIRGLDWEIAKTDPQIFVGIHQPQPFDVIVCSHCGRILPLPNFPNNKSGKLGKHRVCRDCAKRKNIATSSSSTYPQPNVR